MLSSHLMILTDGIFVVRASSSWRTLVSNPSGVRCVLDTIRRRRVEDSDTPVWTVSSSSDVVVAEWMLCRMLNDMLVLVVGVGLIVLGRRPVVLCMIWEDEWECWIVVAEGRFVANGLFC